MLAYLKKNVSFKDADGQWVRIAAGTEIYVDQTNDIGFWLNYHFALHSSEYYTLAEFESDLK